MSSASTDYDGFEVKQLREKLMDADINSLADVGLIDEDTIGYLVTFERSYEPNSGVHHETGEPAYYAENTELWNDIVRRQISKNLRVAIRNGNQSVIQFALGFGSDEEQVEMDFVDFFKLERLLKDSAFMLNVFASPREGKTFTAARICDLWLLFYPHGLIISNIQSWAEKHESGHYEAHVPSAIQKASEHDGPVLLFFDELSSEATHQDLQASGIEPGLRTFLRKMGKEPFSCDWLGIGHRVVEVAPLLRSGEVARFGFKEGASKKAAQKHLVIYEDEDKEDKLCDLEGIGLPEVRPDTHDPAHIEWGTPEDYIELGLMDPEDADDDADSGPPTPQCEEIKDSDERCGQRVWDGHESGLCKMHR